MPDSLRSIPGMRENGIARMGEPSERQRMLDEIARLTRHIASIEEAAVCPECGGSLLSDHDLDCAYWGKKTPAWLHRTNDDA